MSTLLFFGQSNVIPPPESILLARLAAASHVREHHKINKNTEREEQVSSSYLISNCHHCMY